MASLTNYGGIWGQIPNTAGRIYWVAPSASYTVDGESHSASDDNDGLSPERALLTVDRAWNLVTADVGDVIVPLPGTHSPSASIAADIAGVTMMGLPSGAGNPLRQKTVIGAVTGDQNINVTAADIEIAYLHFIPVTADSAVDLSAAADRLHIHHCSFDMATPAASTGTMGIDAIGAASNVLIDHCYFECDGAQGPGITATALLDSKIEDCEFLQSSGTWAAAVVTGAGTDRLYIKRCTFDCTGTAMTIGINGTAADQPSGVIMYDNRFGSLVTVGIDGFGAAEAEVAENYQAGIGATDGGVLITAIT
jgi:hypothetical protein